MPSRYGFLTPDEAKAAAQRIESARQARIARIDYLVFDILSDYAAQLGNAVATVHRQGPAPATAWKLLIRQGDRTVDLQLRLALEERRLEIRGKYGTPDKSDFLLRTLEKHTGLAIKDLRWLFLRRW
jgi:hypothetical protein